MNIQRLFRKQRLAVLSVSLLGVLACSDATRVPDESAILGVPDESAILGYDRTTAQDVLYMARLLGEGLEDVTAREDLHRALRESPLHEYKLTLLGFLESRKGGQVLAAIQEHAGVSERDLDRLLASLPPIDLYVPHYQHRRTWRAREPIAVAALVDEVSPMFANLPNGKLVRINRHSSEPTATAVLLLGPSEWKAERADSRQPRTVEDVIEPPASRKIQTKLSMECEENSPPVGEGDPQVLLEECDEGGGGGGPGGTLDIIQLVTHNIVDNNFPWETNEFELHARDANGLVYEGWRCTGIGPNEDVNVQLECPSTRVHLVSPAEVAYVDVAVIETDSWPNPDDQFSDYRTPPPGFQWHDPRVTDNPFSRLAFLVYPYPSGYSCTPTCTHAVELLFIW